MVYTFKCIKCETECEYNVDKVMEDGDKIELPCETCNNNVTVHKKIWKSYKFNGKFGDTEGWRS